MHTISYRMRQILICSSFALIALLATCFMPTSARAAPLRVVASFSILADMAAQVGGDDVQISTLVKPGSDAHMYEPSTQDARALAQADVLLANGLNFEPWLPRLKSASGFRGTEVIVSEGVKPLALHEDGDGYEQEEHNYDAHNHGEFDPHAWQDVQNAIIYVRNIEAAFAKADPAHASHYSERAQAYISQLQTLDAQIRNTLATLPAQRRLLVTTHDAFGYFAHAYGLTLKAAVGISTSAEPSAAAIARLIADIRKNQVPAVFLENVTNPRLIEQIAKDSGTNVGGRLYSDALGVPGTPVATYINMMQSNLDTLMQALSPAP